MLSSVYSLLNFSGNKTLYAERYINSLFTLGVNIFAWFVFTTNASVGLDATVASWDVEFRDDQDQAMQNFTISVTKMKPGMPDFTKSIYPFHMLRMIRLEIDHLLLYRRNGIHLRN